MPSTSDDQQSTLNVSGWADAYTGTHVLVHTNRCSFTIKYDCEPSSATILQSEACTTPFTVMVRRLLSSVPEGKEADAYNVLGVEPSAASGEIKKRYWRLSLLIHPDKCAHPRANDAFQAVSKASKDLQVGASCQESWCCCRQDFASGSVDSSSLFASSICGNRSGNLFASLICPERAGTAAWYNSLSI